MEGEVRCWRLGRQSQTMDCSLKEHRGYILLFAGLCFRFCAFLSLSLFPSVSLKHDIYFSNNLTAFSSICICSRSHVFKLSKRGRFFRTGVLDAGISPWRRFGCNRPEVESGRFRGTIREGKRSAHEEDRLKTSKHKKKSRGSRGCSKTKNIQGASGASV